MTGHGAGSVPEISVRTWHVQGPPQAGLDEGILDKEQNNSLKSHVPAGTDGELLEQGVGGRLRLGN